MNLCTMIVIIATLYLFVLKSGGYSYIGEPFANISSAVTNVYNRHRESPFQLGRTHYPDYNYPEYIKKEPYYRYFFSPYNSAVYYR